MNSYGGINQIPLKNIIDITHWRRQDLAHFSPNATLTQFHHGGI